MARRIYKTGGSAGRTGLPRRPVVRAAASASTINTTIPAPVGGLNALSNLVEMPPTSAIKLDNFIVRPFGCETRAGSQQYVTGISGYVNSLLPYNGVTQAKDRLFACAGSQIYDVTTSGSSPAVVQSGLANSTWESVCFTTPGGHYLTACNGVDAARLFDGTSWTSFTQVTTPTAPGQVSGVDPSTFTNVAVHKLRLWFTQKDSTAAYYLPINSIGGAATMFDFGPYLPRGGYLVAIGTWTIDGGTGLDDYLIAVSSEGDVAVYKGTDPSFSTSWSLVGVWQLAAPVGKRCILKFGGDLLYLSSDGLEVMSKYMQSDRLDAHSAITNTIQQTISDLTSLNGSLFGWQIVSYPAENILLINIPSQNGLPAVQYVYNTVTSAWSSFSGWDSMCWVTQNEKIYYGTNGSVNRAFVGFTDNANLAGANGAAYQATAQQAFNYFGRPGQKKQFKLVRLTTTTNAIPQITVGINIDFEFGVHPAGVAGLSAPPILWGATQWGVASWAKDFQTIRSWQSVTGIGYAASLTVVIDVVSKTTWAASDWVLEVAGVI